MGEQCDGGIKCSKFEAIQLLGGLNTVRWRDNIVSFKGINCSKAEVTKLLGGFKYSTMKDKSCCWKDG